MRLVAGWATGTWLVLIAMPILAEVLVSGLGPATAMIWYWGLTVESRNHYSVGLSVGPAVLLCRPTPDPILLMLYRVLEALGLDWTNVANH